MNVPEVKTDENLLSSLAVVRALRDRLRECSMIYQYEAKAEAAAFYGVPLAEVNRSFVEWEVIRGLYDRARITGERILEGWKRAHPELVSRFGRPSMREEAAAFYGVAYEDVDVSYSDWALLKTLWQSLRDGLPIPEWAHRYRDTAWPAPRKLNQVEWESTQSR